MVIETADKHRTVSTIMSSNSKVETYSREDRYNKVMKRKSLKKLFSIYEESFFTCLLSGNV